MLWRKFFLPHWFFAPPPAIGAAFLAFPFFVFLHFSGANMLDINLEPVLLPSCAFGVSFFFFSPRSLVVQPMGDSLAVTFPWTASVFPFLLGYVFVQKALVMFFLPRH